MLQVIFSHTKPVILVYKYLFWSLPDLCNFLLPPMNSPHIFLPPSTSSQSFGIFPHLPFLIILLSVGQASFQILDNITCFSSITVRGVDHFEISSCLCKIVEGMYTFKQKNRSAPLFYFLKVLVAIL